MNEPTVANHKALYLTDADKAIATKVVATITKIVQVDTIFVLGKKENTAHNIFMEPCAANAHTSAFWLLVLITGDDKRHKIYQDEIEQKCNHFHAVSCIVMQTSTFVRWLSAKDPFALTLLLNAPLIYNTNPELIEWGKNIIEENIPAAKKTGFQKCFNLLNEYIAGAALFTVRKHYKLALFMYHQATELLLTAFIKSQTGLELHIHNINHLNQYLSFLAPGIAADFWGATQKEQEAFRLLQKSYCSARYDADFEVGYAQLEIVRQKVSRAIQELKEISSLIFKEAGRFPRLNIV